LLGIYWQDLGISQFKFVHMPYLTSIDRADIVVTQIDLSMDLESKTLPFNL